MPLVFAENELSESGIEYDDRTGVSYEFPRRYRQLIQPGERFVYYRGRKRKDNRRALQVYFGTGIVGDVSEAQNGRLKCRIEKFRRFKQAVPFKQGKRDYLESGGLRRGYFQPGVRTISVSDFDRILAASE